MKKSLNLSGKWKLYYYDSDEVLVSSPKELQNESVNCVNATVPGNVELDLANSGIIPKELFKGMATVENYKLEAHDWWYEKEFNNTLKNAKRIFIKFGAVDCLADYYINGEKFASSDNAFIEQKFDVTDLIKDGKNILQVHIKSAARFALKQDLPMNIITERAYTAYLRKPAHSFGWDIFPRTVSAGIWKDVELIGDDSCGFLECSYYVDKFGFDKCEIVFKTQFEVPYKTFSRDIEVKVTGICGRSKFSKTFPANHFKVTVGSVVIENPEIWWPYGYGEANVYDVKFELIIDGKVYDIRKMNMGIRKVELVRTETMLEKNHCFKFVINDTDIMCKGSNWVPLNPYHSMDKAKYQKALELFSDTHCNILRVWGGGVYEQEEFYDYCDRHGIMVWQDFMMACNPMIMNDEMMKNLEKEFTWAVVSLRNHPSIVLWAGDNEIDEHYAYRHRDTDGNIITRELLPHIININDCRRPYLPSSPYLPGKYADGYENAEDIYVERHLWGARDYYKADFYKNSKAHFVSETGYHGCPNVKSLKKIVDDDCVFPVYNEQWCLHSSDQSGNMSRVKLMEDQIRQLFDFVPDNIDDFSLASQISQAEAKKYFIERVRIKKPYTSGIIWWNMLDGWPQMSDAVVDYFFDKKLAYEYIKRSQEPFCLMIDDMKDWTYDIVASNDTLNTVNGSFKVSDIDTGEELCKGNMEIFPNSNLKVGEIPLMYPEKRFLVVEWNVNGKTYFNHFLCGFPGFDFKNYKKSLNKFKKYIKEK